MAEMECSLAGHYAAWIPPTVLARNACTGQTPDPTGVCLLIILSAIVFVMVHVP